MKELTIHVPDWLANRISQGAQSYGVSESEVAAWLMRWGYSSRMIHSRTVLDPNRSQRPDAINDPRLRWWQDAKFGMFIHWGLYAVPAGVYQGRSIPQIGEWIMYYAAIPIKEYEQFAPQFDPVDFNAAEWVSLAKRAGQKYLIITAKHHDGFCLWHTKQTDYNIVDATPFGRDILKELADECAKQDLQLGFYYSQTQDWHHPGGYGNDWDFDPETKDFDGYIERFVKPQVRELLTGYGPLAVIWFDTPMVIAVEQSRSLLDMVHDIQPDCLVSGRLGNGLGDYASVGDNQIPKTTMNLDWETPATMNDTWGFKTNDHHWKSSEELIHKLVDITSKGGNYLLNVGPTATGIIPQPSVERLEAMGTWLDVNGEAIYGAKAGPIQGQSWCRTTQKEGTIYLHVLEWPEGGEIRLNGMRASSARLLASDRELPVSPEGDGILVQGPADAPDTPISVIALSGLTKEA
jgi:alpha-L-fucosidase